ncbi:unnamed protein product [Staurois parvus]|uniref:Uncharacterized protein n=1 Tax=Staurois parvus TaxID=386267 RepID=A0ABN9G3T0_9NEOB|nr:unnamed protein product [Staurois parvus]
MWGAFFPLTSNVRDILPTDHQCKGTFIPTDLQCKEHSFPLTPNVRSISFPLTTNVRDILLTDHQCKKHSSHCNHHVRNILPTDHQCKGTFFPLTTPM